jgi:tRNA 2-selenouridine synthase
MALHILSASDALQQLSQFDAIIDARSPGEFALDHLPGAENWPSLNDQERITIGTMYKQVNPFEAKKRGAAMVARNAAEHIEAHLLDAPKSWRPLLYCWRGGNRSGAQATILSAIGFRVSLLEGGYKAFRAAMVADTLKQVARLRFRVVAGPTGVGKTHILHALAALGHQVLDLEALANHRSSVLGLHPGQVQPTQKHFDTRLWSALKDLDSEREVFVESESKRVGNVSVPEALITAMRASPCVRIDMPLPERVRLLLRDYAHFVTDSASFVDRLDTLVALLGHETINAWKAAVAAGDTASVVQALLDRHYDPRYFESMARNFSQYHQSPIITVHSADGAALAAAASAVALTSLQHTSPVPAR